MLPLFVIIAFLAYFFLGVRYSGDHLSFLWEREFYSSYLDFFVHILSFDRTRHTIAPNSMLFRPGFTFFLTIEDVFFRTWPTIQVAIRILIHSVNVFILFKILQFTKLNKIAVLCFSFLFLIRFPNTKLINEIHFGPYLFVVLFCGLGFLFFLQKRNFFWVSLCFFCAALFHEFVALGLIIFCFLSCVYKKLFHYRKTLLLMTGLYLGLNAVSFLAYPLQMAIPVERSYFNILSSGIVHTFYLLGRFFLTFFIPNLFNASTSMSYILYLSSAALFLFLIIKHKRNGAIFLFSLLFLLSLASLVALGRGGMGSLSYLQSTYWNEYFAGFFLILIFAALFEKQMKRLPIYAWCFFILFQGYSAISFVKRKQLVPTGMIDEITFALEKNGHCIKVPQPQEIESKLPSILWKGYFCTEIQKNIYEFKVDLTTVPVVPNGDDFIRQNNLYWYFNLLSSK